MKPCPICKGNEILEIRVQMDQKVYVKCLCTGNTLKSIVAEAFREGYLRCQEDNKFHHGNPQ